MHARYKHSLRHECTHGTSHSSIGERAGTPESKCAVMLAAVGRRFRAIDSRPEAENLRAEPHEPDPERDSDMACSESSDGRAWAWRCGVVSSTTIANSLFLSIACYHW